jgi:hypothetical protein
MMSNKARAYLAVAAVIAAVAAVPAGLLSAYASSSAEASTTACGDACTSPFNEQAGSGEVLAVSGSGSSASVVMATESTTNSAEDWTPEEELQNVSQAASEGLISQRLDVNYGNDSIFEFQYAPNGVPSGYCLADGASNTGINGTPAYFYQPTLTVGLAQCGITPATLWIPDNNDSGNEPCDLINAGYEAESNYGVTEGTFNSPFAEPAVLTVSGTGSSPKVGLAPLSEIGGVVSASQEWAGLSPQVDGALRESAAREKAAAAKAGG